VISNKEEDEAYFLDQEQSGLYNNKVWECIGCYLNLPKTLHLDQILLNYAHIRGLQQQDEQLLALQIKHQNDYINKPVEAGPWKQCFAMEAVPYFVSYGTYCCI
jgi:hypothetical protein